MSCCCALQLICKIKKKKRQIYNLCETRGPSLWGRGRVLTTWSWVVEIWVLLECITRQKGQQWPDHWRSSPGCETTWIWALTRLGSLKLAGKQSRQEREGEKKKVTCVWVERSFLSVKRQEEICYNLKGGQSAVGLNKISVPLGLVDVMVPGGMRSNVNHKNTQMTAKCPNAVFDWWHCGLIGLPANTNETEGLVGVRNKIKLYYAIMQIWAANHRLSVAGSFNFTIPKGVR